MTSDWENWKVSLENENVLSDLFSHLNSSTTSSPCLWWELFNYKSLLTTKLESEMNETNQDQLTKEEMYVIDAIKESLSTNVSILESSFSGIPYNSFTKIFNLIRHEIDDSKFSTFVDVIKSWKSDFLVEESLKAIVLSKVFMQKRKKQIKLFVHKQVTLILMCLSCRVKKSHQHVQYSH